MFFIVYGQPTEKDKNGFISKLLKDGSVSQLKWVNGLNAPKGMAKFKEKLYVSDIDELVEIDIASGKIIKKYKAERARFLNDVTIDSNGIVYVSDSYQNLIYRLIHGKMEIWLKVGNLFKPNGLLIDGPDLLVGCDNYILTVNIESKEVRTFISETGPVDGLVKISNELFLISDWSGKIHLVSKNEPKKLILSSDDDKLNAADFEYIKPENLLLVPTFFDNRVMAYEVVIN